MWSTCDPAIYSSAYISEDFWSQVFVFMSDTCQASGAGGGLHKYLNSHKTVPHKQIPIKYKKLQKYQKKQNTHKKKKNNIWHSCIWGLELRQFPGVQENLCFLVFGLFGIAFLLCFVLFLFFGNVFLVFVVGVLFCSYSGTYVIRPLLQRLLTLSFMKTNT